MPGTLTKADIINTIQRENGYSRPKATELIESLLELIKTTLESGEDVLVSGFGKFCIQSKKEQRGRNPAIFGETCNISNIHTCRQQKCICCIFVPKKECGRPQYMGVS